MATYIMLGKYTAEGIKGAAPDRTKKIMDMVAKCGGKVETMFALLGEYDLGFRVQFPGTTEAMKASFTVSRATGISLTTLPAMPIEEFDKLLS
jgi:uncharacterized protein with GYD domain